MSDWRCRHTGIPIDTHQHHPYLHFPFSACVFTNDTIDALFPTDFPDCTTSTGSIHPPMPTATTPFFVRLLHDTTIGALAERGNTSPAAAGSDDAPSKIEAVHRYTTNTTPSCYSPGLREDTRRHTTPPSPPNLSSTTATTSIHRRRHLCTDSAPSRFYCTVPLRPMGRLHIIRLFYTPVLYIGSEAFLRRAKMGGRQKHGAKGERKRVEGRLVCNVSMSWSRTRGRRITTNNFNAANASLVSRLLSLWVVRCLLTSLPARVLTRFS